MYTTKGVNMQSVIQVLKVNDTRKGVSRKTGNPYEMQDAECMLLTADGVCESVGVLQIPRELMGKVQPGIFTGSFALRPNMSSRRIEAVLTHLTPVPSTARPVAAPKAAAV
jgi:hypothetical protein